MIHLWFIHINNIPALLIFKHWTFPNMATRWRRSKEIFSTTCLIFFPIVWDSSSFEPVSRAQKSNAFCTEAFQKLIFLYWHLNWAWIISLDLISQIMKHQNTPMIIFKLFTKKSVRHHDLLNIQYIKVYEILFLIRSMFLDNFNQNSHRFSL